MSDQGSDHVAHASLAYRRLEPTQSGPESLKTRLMYSVKRSLLLAAYTVLQRIAIHLKGVRQLSLGAQKLVHMLAASRE